MQVFNDLLIFLTIASFASAIMYFLKFREKRNFKDYTYIAAALPRLYLGIISLLFKFSVPQIDTLDLIVAILAVVVTDTILSIIYLAAKKFIKEIQLQSSVEDLKTLGNKFTVLMESATFGIFTMDQDGKIEMCNQSFAKILESTREELIGKNLFAFLDSSCTVDLLTQRKFSCPFVNLTTASGKVIKVQVSGGASMNGHKTITGSLHILD